VERIAPSAPHYLLPHTNTIASQLARIRRGDRVVARAWIAVLLATASAPTSRRRSECGAGNAEERERVGDNQYILATRSVRGGERATTRSPLRIIGRGSARANASACDWLSRPFPACGEGGRGVRATGCAPRPPLPGLRALSALASGGRGSLMRRSCRSSGRDR
jgi:hypothetical protein